MLRLNMYIALFIIGALFLNGCVKSSQNEKEIRPEIIDTLQVPKTMEFMLFSTGKIQTSTISGFFDDLLKKKQYDLLNQYLLVFGNTNPQDPEIKGVVTLYKGLICNNQMQYDSAKIYYDEAIYSFTYAKNSQLLVKALIASADNAGELGDFEKAIIERYHAINILNFRTSETYEKFTQIGELGDDYLNIEKTSVAIEFIDSALTYFYQINDSAKIADMLSAKSYALLLTGDFDRSLNHAKHSLKIRILIRDSLKIAEAYNNLAVSEMSGKHWSEALGHLEIAEKMFQELNYEKEQHKILLNKGHCFFQLGDKEKALASLQKALDMSSERNQLNEVKVALQTIAYIYSKYGDYKNAYLYYVKYNAAKDAVFSKEKEMAIRDIITKSKMAQNEQKLLFISREKEFADKKNELFVWLLVLSLFLGVSFISFFVIQARKNKQLNITRQKLQESEIDRLQQEMKSKKLALENFTKSLVSKSKLVSELENTINEYKSKDNNRQIIEEIGKLRDMRILTDDDWKTFKGHFERCYPGFIYYVKYKISNLSPAELRLFLLIKLNLDTNDTASMLGISPASVKKAQYRLKNKLGLNNDDDLFVYINTEFNVDGKEFPK